MKDNKTEVELNKLENGVQFLNLKSEALALCHVSFSVNAGRYHESTQPLGFTHLAEHMLFAPSTRYPEPGYIHKLIEQNGGSINAWTNTSSINIHLSLPTTKLVDLMPVIIDVFFNPEITPEGLHTEIDAIDSEFTLKQHDDLRRLLSVQQTLAPASHPFSRFTVGNKQTFSTLDEQTLVDDLNAFYRQHFCGENVVVGIASPASLDNKLIKSVLADINKIPAGTRQAFPARPTLEFNDSKPFVCKVRPILPSESLIQSFLLPINSHDEIDNQAMSLLQHFVLSDHDGGLVSTLRQCFQLEHIAFASGIEDIDVEELQIRMTFNRPLNSRDVVDISNITRLVLQRLADQQLKTWRLREKQREHDILNYLSQNNIEQSDVVDVVEAIQRGKYSTVPNSHTFLSKAVSKRYHQIAEEVVGLPHNIIWFSQHGEVSQVTDYYQAEYEILDLESLNSEQKTSAKLDVDTLLPPRNPYVTSIPKDVNDIDSESIQQVTKPNCRFIFLQYRVENKAVGDIYLSVATPNMSATRQNILAKRLWLEGAQEFLKEKYHRAEAAGLYVRVYGHQSGICIHTSGLCEKQILLLLDVLNDLQRLTLSRRQFENAKAKLSKKLNKSLLQKPINKLVSTLNHLKSPQVIDPLELLHLTQQFSFESFDNVQNAFFSVVSLEALMVGAWEEQVPERLWQNIKNRDFLKHEWSKPLPTLPTEPPQFLVKVDASPYTDHAAVLHYELEQHVESSNLNNFQGLDSNDFNVVLALIIEIVLSPLLFVEMRNVRQLGYAVGIGYKPINQIPGLLIYAQTPNIPPSHLCAEIFDSLKTVIMHNEQLDEQIQFAKQQLHQQLAQMPRDCASLSRHMWMYFDKPDPLHHSNSLAELAQSMSNQVIRNALYKMIEEDYSPLCVQTLSE